MGGSDENQAGGENEARNKDKNATFTVIWGGGNKYIGGEIGKLEI